MKEELDYPNATLKLTKSKKGVLLVFPNPHSGVAHTYVTSVAYLKYLLEGGLSRDMLGCKYLGDAPYNQFLSKNDKKINTVDVNGLNPFSATAVKKRDEMKVKNVDEW